MDESNLRLGIFLIEHKPHLLFNNFPPNKLISKQPHRRKSEVITLYFPRDAPKDQWWGDGDLEVRGLRTKAVKL